MHTYVYIYMCIYIYWKLPSYRRLSRLSHHHGNHTIMWINKINKCTDNEWNSLMWLGLSLWIGALTVRNGVEKRQLVRKWARKSVRAVCWPCPARPGIIVGLWRALASLSIGFHTENSYRHNLIIANEFQRPNVPNTCWAIPWSTKPVKDKGLDEINPMFSGGRGLWKPDVLRQTAAKKNRRCYKQVSRKAPNPLKQKKLRLVQVKYGFSLGNPVFWWNPGFRRLNRVSSTGL